MKTRKRMEKFLKLKLIITILSLLNRSFVASECMPNIITADEACIQIGYNPSIPDPSAKPAMNVNTSVGIRVSI